jgi:hypothetical protein
MFLIPRSHELIALSWWGVVYFGLVVTHTRNTSLAVEEIVEELVLPSISCKLADSVRINIQKKFSRRQILMKSLSAASIAIFISCALLRQFHWPQLCAWGVGFFILYFTASQATLTAPFYTRFSASLRDHSDVLFPVDPAASPAIHACTSLAKRILWYWFVVSALVMSLMAVPYIWTFLLASRFGTWSGSVSRFIAVVVFVAGFFSFGFGSLVYLRSENDLRIAVDRLRLATLSTVQTRYCELFSNERALSTEEQSQLDHLKSTSDYLSRYGNLRDSLETLASAVAAILPPFATILGAVLTYRKGR